MAHEAHNLLRRKKVLMLTNSEHGQANVHLAVAYAMLQQDPSTEVHIASFPRLAKFVTEMSDFAVQNIPGASPIQFHGLRGTSFIDCILNPDIDFFSVANTTPSFWTLFTVLGGMSVCMGAWNAEQFMEVYRSCIDIIDKVDADIVAVDNLFFPGVTACHHIECNWLMLSPNSLKDFVANRQPKLAGLWKYPSFGLICEYPIPWYQRLLNVVYSLCGLYMAMTNDRVKEIKHLVKAETGKEAVVMMDLMKSPPAGVPILISNLPELDFPLTTMPDIVTCGPILRPTASVAEEDPELFKWLCAGPTVLINLGTHCLTGEPSAIEMAKALRLLFDMACRESKLSGLRVLWKMKQPPDEPYSVDVKSSLYDILNKEMLEDRVRIEEWIKVEPGAILETGQVICSINHGGASSWNEAICAGVPQIILAQWVDTYDYAIRTEMLGIGLFGNKQTPPGWTAQELGPKLVATTVGESAATMRSKVQELSRLCCMRPGGLGRDFAARFILEKA
ncbi:hypothetical protein PFICI_02381 [Pestalotiopsis fici W106-1]|uniref:Erythromycin biosynthesis protein CIII-like C-terminal domain-containing protein n=1 Tax=Pestalotiopsis fici (strain W106-1 / CGMCC3.15140) TaxID=1229662 RepID=W3XGM3_PESFW|nr:uncharacterized protein PFICI_02381 [Pestalotiopsis fici W106-1]ETS84356.1 hypothetical protein PFICI_02381 [Pestalotiopsis fici W106-1]